MLTAEENELLTRIGPGTPAGELIRRYWQPAALSEELPVNGAPLPVRLLGEELVLFRCAEGPGDGDQGTGDGHGRSLAPDPRSQAPARYGLLGLHCSHRGADLSYGRLEDGGLRCIYHGWLYDRNGRCLEQPGEPAFRWTGLGDRDLVAPSGLEAQHEVRGTFAGKIRHPAYPCIEQAGVIFAYLGPGEPPLLPAYEFLTVPTENRFVGKIFSECNYLQGNEGNQDPVHLSFLHTINTDAARTINPLSGRERVARIECEETDWGVRIYAVRAAGPGRRLVRISNAVLPNLTCFAGGPEDGHSVNWHVPIDDTHHWKYTFIFRRGGPLDNEATARGRSEVDASYHPIRNKGNRYLQDREEQRTGSFTGMGDAFQIHDFCVTEGSGPIQDRTAEHLGPCDIGIMTTRRVMLNAIRDVQEGLDPPHVVRHSEDNHFPDLVTVLGLGPDTMDVHAAWKPEFLPALVSARQGSPPD